MNQVSPGAPGEMLPPAASEPQHRKKGFSVGDYVERFALVIAWLVVIVLFSILAPETFFNVRNFTTMFGTQTTLVILALALLIPLDGRRLRHLRRGHADAVGNGRRRPERAARRADRPGHRDRHRARRLDRLHQRVLHHLLRDRRLHRDAGHRHHHLGAHAVAQRVADDQRSVGMAVELGRRPSDLRHLLRVLLRARSSASSSGTSSTTRRSGVASCSWEGAPTSPG